MRHGARGAAARRGRRRGVHAAAGVQGLSPPAATSATWRHPNLVECARRLDAIRRRDRPPDPPRCRARAVLRHRDTEEAIDFFRKLARLAEARGVGDIVRTTSASCYDVCHQAVEFEDVAASIRARTTAGVRINKVHISCALQLDDRVGTRRVATALRRYVEPRYLHQTLARTPDGRLAARWT